MIQAEPTFTDKQTEEFRKNLINCVEDRKDDARLEAMEMQREMDKDRDRKIWQDYPELLRN